MRTQKGFYCNALSIIYTYIKIFGNCSKTRFIKQLTHERRILMKHFTFQRCLNRKVKIIDLRLNAFYVSNISMPKFNNSNNNNNNTVNMNYIFYRRKKHTSNYNVLTFAGLMLGQRWKSSCEATWWGTGFYTPLLPSGGPLWFPGRRITWYKLTGEHR